MTGIIRYAQGESVLGAFVAAMSPRGLAMIEFGGLRPALLDGLRARFPEAGLAEDAAGMTDLLARVAGLVEHPEVSPGLPLDLPLDLRGSEFELRVWAALRAIPPGRTMSYGEIAASLGSPREAREVGAACAANMVAIAVPCHRVVKKDGGLAGYRWGTGRKRVLLAREHRATFALA
jgi:AraC family transcriptional regulator of adaptative response/methylated-DNA-[protein]-cysteine methyltransferase